MIQLHNSGSAATLESVDNKFELSISSDSILLEMNLTVNEMQELIDYATAEIQKIKAI